jgi:hypothetical protein
MSALPLLAWFLGGAFLTDAIPHFVAGLQGRAFQSPFAKLPGQDLSSARGNVVWGFINLVLGWGLLTQVGAFDIRHCADAAALGAGILAMGLGVAGHFGRFYGGSV